MEYKLFYVVLIYSIAFTSAEIRCKNDVSNEEYVAKDTDITDRLDNLTETFTLKMQKLTEHLNTIMANISNKLNSESENNKETTQNLKKQLDTMNSHILNSSHVLKDNMIKNFENQLQPLNKHLKSLTKTVKWPRSCNEAMRETQRSGVYDIQLPAFSLEPFDVFCDNEKFEGNWTVVMRRMDGSVDFYRNWMEYKNGFGNLNGEFFIGLDKLHFMTTSSAKPELLVVLKDSQNVTKYAKYNSFSIGGENEQYKINELGTYTGDAGDSLTQHLGMKFTTKDVDNTSNEGNSTCAVYYSGAWWFTACYYSHLFGRYSLDNKEKGIRWISWTYENLRFAEMLIRPAK